MDAALGSDIDPITLEIWWNRLIAAVDESATALLRTAFSTIVRESNDFATLLMNTEGESVAECSGGIPAFAHLVSRATRSMLRKFPAPQWLPGDAVITNDPWIATGHLPDLTVVSPIFHEGRLVGFAGCAAHAPDIGGTPSAATREIFEEGLFIPPLRLDRAGERNQTLHEMLLGNVRLPEQVRGDLEAQVTANEVCRNRVADFLRGSGESDLRRISRAVQQRSEAALRRAIAELPDGRYESRIRADGVPGRPTEIHCAITVEGERLRVDYTGSSPQVDVAINCTLNYTRAYTIYPIKCALAPRLRRNEGAYRPIEVVAPSRSIVNAERPAPVGARHLTGHLLSCAVYQALAQAAPERVIADSGGAPALRARFSGRTPQGRSYAQILFASGGMGASAHGDGLSTTAFPTNSGAGSVEAFEAAAPLLFVRKEYRTDSGGPGRLRGGLGQVCEVRNLAPEPVQLSVLGDRAEHPALGVLGGGEGAVARVVTSDGRGVDLKGRAGLPGGASVRFEFAGGGGYGPPDQRERAEVRRDVSLGYVSREAARRDYPAVDIEDLMGEDKL